LSLIAALTITFAVSLPAQQATQRTDPEFARLVKEWTTSPEFLSPLVDHLPLADGIPTTRDVLGYYVGQPRTLTHTADAIRYYRALEAKSPRVKVLSIGKTDEGREQVIVFVASEDTIKRLEEYRGYLAKIADPRGASDAEMKAVIAKAKPIYHLSGGLHSAETGPPEMLMELAYRLTAGESDLIKQIRENVIVSITPAADPDGRDRYVDWYYQHLIDIDNERDRISGPPYWGKYIYHDNNRDINYSQVTMKNALDWYLQWHPPIWHDLHESVPFMYTFSGQAPQNPTLDPILYGEMPWFANFEMAQMIKYGMPGVWTHGFVDMWSPGYLAFAASNHNGMIRMYETFGNGGATTMKRTVANPEFPGAANQTTREWYRPLPPYKEVTWSMRNNTNYMETGVLSALQLASSFPKVILENYYQKTLNSISQGEKSAPHGYIIPAGQRDRSRVALLVNLLRVQGIEIGQLTSELKLSDGTYPSGSYVIKQNQPYGRLAKILLEKQDFPDQNLRTYDDTGWTMGLMLQTEVKATADKAVLAATTTPVDKVVVSGTLSPAAAGKAAAYVIPNTGSNSMITLRFRLKDFYVKANDAAFKVGDREIPAGSFVISATQPAKPPTKMAMDGTPGLTKAIETLGLDAIGVDAMPTVAMHDVDVPRVAIYSTWGNTQEVGWVRHAFDQFETPFDLIYKERVRKGGLRANYDVIVIPNQHRRHGARGCRRVPEVRQRWGRAGHARDGELLPRRVRRHAKRECHASEPTVLRARSDHRGRDSQRRAPDLLRLHRQEGTGPLRQRSPAAGAGRRQWPDPDALPGRRRRGAQWPDEGRQRGAESSRHRRCADGEGPRGVVRGQPVLPLAEPRRVRDAVQHDPALERHAGAGRVEEHAGHAERGNVEALAPTGDRVGRSPAPPASAHRSTASTPTAAGSPAPGAPAHSSPRPTPARSRPSTSRARRRAARASSRCSRRPRRSACQSPAETPSARRR